MPRPSLLPQIQFNADLRVINDCLDGLIKNAQETRQEDDYEALQARDYSKVRDTGCVVYLYPLRGEARRVGYARFRRRDMHCFWSCCMAWFTSLHNVIGMLFLLPQVKDPSLLRFLVDMRGEDATNKQLRDDLVRVVASVFVHVLCSSVGRDAPQRSCMDAPNPSATQPHDKSQCPAHATQRRAGLGRQPSP